MKRSSVRRVLTWLALAATAGMTGGCGLMKMSRQDEIRLGYQAASQVDQQHRTWEDATLSRIGQEMAAVSDRPDYPYRFRMIEDKEANAFALPGGPIYVTTGILKLIEGKEDELAALLGHEITHVAHRHAAQQIERQQWIGVGIAVFTKGDFQTAASIVANLEELGYSRQHEREADRYGAVYLIRANRDPEAEVRLMERLARQEKGGGISFLRTHPGGQERANLIRKAIRSGELSRLAVVRPTEKKP